MKIPPLEQNPFPKAWPALVVQAEEALTLNHLPLPCPKETEPKAKEELKNRREEEGKEEKEEEGAEEGEEEEKEEKEEEQKEQQKKEQIEKEELEAHLYSGSPATLTLGTIYTLLGLPMGGSREYFPLGILPFGSNLGWSQLFLPR